MSSCSIGNQIDSWNQHRRWNQFAESAGGIVRGISYRIDSWNRTVETRQSKTPSRINSIPMPVKVDSVLKPMNSVGPNPRKRETANWGRLDERTIN